MTQQPYGDIHWLIHCRNHATGLALGRFFLAVPRAAHSQCRAQNIIWAASPGASPASKHFTSRFKVASSGLYGRLMKPFATDSLCQAHIQRSIPSTGIKAFSVGITFSFMRRWWEQPFRCQRFDGQVAAKRVSTSFSFWNTNVT
ncbi:hypothetical protein P3T23_009839 [Paraburkholderia sp. GAS448]